MGKQAFQCRVWLFTCISLLFAYTAFAAALDNTSPKVAPWVFRADWTGGYSGWMSFPLAQDIGYDPSIYTEKSGSSVVLRHNFLSHGEPKPWFGFVRPLAFSANAHSTIALRYRLNIAGRITHLELMLTSPDGHRYSAPLPAEDGEHAVQITGAQLHLTTETPIQTVILRGRLEHPPVHSESQWILEEFLLHADRTPEVALSLPALDQAEDGSWVASAAISRDGELKLERKSASLPAQISLADGSGKPVLHRVMGAGETQLMLPLGENADPGLWEAEITQGQARTTFRFLVLGQVPPHPRLLLPKSRLDELRQQPRYATLRKQIHHRAETLASTISYNSYAGNNIDLMPSGPGIQPTAPGQLRPYMELLESYSDAVAYNALDYRLNGNIDALTAARKALATMAQWKTWVPPRFSEHGMYTYYEVGVTAQRVAFGYDLIADELSPKEKENVSSAFWKLVIHPTIEEYFTYNRDPIAASNWMANSVGGALAAAVAVAGDTPQWNQRDAAAIAKLQFAYEELLKGLFPGDGSEAEPYGYENFAMRGISWGMSALAALHIRPQGANRMIESFWWPYYVTVRSGLQLDTGDFNGHLTGLPGFAWGAAFTNIPELRALYDSGTHLDLSKGAPTGQNGHLLEEKMGPLDLACCSKPAPAFQPPPPSRVFPLRGSAALRSGWGADSTVISLRLGPWFNHEHRDEGSFQVAAFGSELISEAGYANYYSDPHYADYFSQAAGHNTLLVDGNPFSQTALAGRFWPAFKHPHFTAQMLATGFDYLSADLTSAYDGVLQKYERQFVFLKPDILIVRDRVRAPQEHTFSWLLHTPPNSKLSTQGASASIQTKTANASVIAAGKNVTWTTAITPIQVTLFTDLDREHLEPRRELRLTSPRTTETQFLVGMKFKAGLSSANSELKSWSEPFGDGLRTTDSSSDPASVVFRSGPGKLAIDALTTDGSVLAQHGAANRSDWLAIGAKDVEEGQQAVFRSQLPADVAWEHTDSGIELTVRTTGKDSLAIFSATRPASVTVDGKPVAIAYRGKLLTVPLAMPGEHHVSLQ